MEEEVKKKRNLKGILVIFVAIAIVIVSCVSINYFAFLKARLYEERKSHMVELAGNVTERVDNVIRGSWQQVLACEHIIRIGEILSAEDLLEVLESTSDFIDESNSLVLAFDQKGEYYSSDQNVGHWTQTEMLAEMSEDRYQAVTEIPHKNEHSYVLFIKRLDTPVLVGTGSITHIAVAVDMEFMLEQISADKFSNMCYVYLADKDGEQLSNFILHDGIYDSFVQGLQQGEDAVWEFEYADEEGSRESWFVVNAPIAAQNWQVFVFVPTQALGVDTTLLGRTIIFFAVVSLVFIAMVTLIIVVVLDAKTDRQLVHQKDEADQLLQTVAQEANSANQAKSDFLSHMSHDIRTPLNGIMGMTDIALKNIGNQDKISDCLKKISSSSQHLLGLINDVLDMSRMESGKTKVNHESFDLRLCINNCISIIGGQLETRNLDLIKEVAEFDHPYLIGDELHMRQVFINILGNSVKFTLDGGKIYFRAMEKESTDDRALFRFELADTGIGMKEEFLPRLFDAFAQEDDGMRTTYKGTGLGMAITKRFVDLMGGTIAVESKLNVGTTFIIEIWIDIDKEAKAAACIETAQGDLNGMKVLLVEDIELNLEIAQSILEDVGAVITPAMNGQEAVDAFTSNPEGTFDVIIMDIMMPVMDGITATKTIRAMERPDAKTIPIIAMTANAYEEDIRNTKAAGMNAHLSKPIDTGILFNTLFRFYSGEQEEEKAVELKGMKILLADDVEINLEIAKEILESEGAVVVMTENGQQAVEAFKNSPEGTFDVILMDVHMPVMDGLTATRTIRALDRDDAHSIPILAMTADVYDEDIRKTREAGMDGHLAKPLDVEKIIWQLSGYRVKGQ